jgi:hypothetical protein
MTERIWFMEIEVLDKRQMISFCKISELYNKEIYPDIYPCEKWILK